MTFGVDLDRVLAESRDRELEQVKIHQDGRANRKRCRFDGCRLQVHPGVNRGRCPAHAGMGSGRTAVPQLPEAE